MKIKPILFLLFLFLNSIFLRSQDTIKTQSSAKLPVYYRANFFAPGVSCEKALSSRFSVNTELGTNMAFGIANAEVEYNLSPYLKLELRGFYNLKKRALKNKNIANNSGNYFALYSIFNNNQMLLGPVWGFQRNLKSLSTNFLIGYGFNYGINKAKHMPIFQLSLGFLIKENQGLNISNNEHKAKKFPFGVGMIYGINYSNIKRVGNFDQANKSIWGSYYNRKGIDIGLVLNYSITKNSFVQAGISYTHKGFSFPNSLWKVNYLELPLQVGFRNYIKGKSLNTMVGGYYAILMYTYQVSMIQNPIDYGISAGFNFDLNKNIQVGANYLIGLADIGDNYWNIYNRTLRISTAYFIGRSN